MFVFLCWQEWASVSTHCHSVGTRVLLHFYWDHWAQLTKPEQSDLWPPGWLFTLALSVICMCARVAPELFATFFVPKCWRVKRRRRHFLTWINCWTCFHPCVELLWLWSLSADALKLTSSLQHHVPSAAALPPHCVPLKCIIKTLQAQAARIEELQQLINS